MRFLIDFFRWLFYGTPAAPTEGTASAASTVTSAVCSEDEPAPPPQKKKEFTITDLRVLASGDDFLDELRAIRPGSDFVQRAKDEMVAELRRIAASRRRSRKDAA